MVSSADADYRANPNGYGPGTENAMGIAKSVSGDADQVGGVLALYDYPTLGAQVSGTWLGGGVQNALQAASEFLVAQGKLDEVLDSYADSATPKFAQMVLDGGC
jgi:taurine transport system substrate-binding protein